MYVDLQLYVPSGRAVWRRRCQRDLFDIRQATSPPHTPRLVRAVVIYSIMYAVVQYIALDVRACCVSIYLYV